MSETTKDGTNITPTDLNGDWDYECEMILPETFFPREFINNDPELIADRHGGIVNFHMISQSTIRVMGKRTWRDIKDRDDCLEKLKIPKRWTAENSMVFHHLQLLYQYRIDGISGINGISNVHLIRNPDDGKLSMTGWFYYVPSKEMLLNMNQPKDERGEDTDRKLIKQKRELNEWLNLFGRVKLTKR